MFTYIFNRILGIFTRTPGFFRVFLGASVGRNGAASSLRRDVRANSAPENPPKPPFSPGKAGS